MLAERRKLQELVALYKLHPELRDVYVEGDSDRSFIEWFIGEKGLNRVNIYCIETVEIPQDAVRTANVENNNRGRGCGAR